MATRTTKLICQLLCGLCLFTGPLEAHSLTVETSHSDVNLWSRAGRSYGKALVKIRRAQEFKVLRSTRLKNGQVWYQVKQGRRTGWVDSRYFTKSKAESKPAKTQNKTKAKKQNDEDRRRKTEARACQDCGANERSSSNKKNPLEDFAAISKAASRNGFIWPASGVNRGGYGMRAHPITGSRRFHAGIDISQNNGSPVRAAQDGTVELSAGGCRTGSLGCNGGAGNMVIINHGNGLKTVYMHLNPSCRLPARGTKISQGAMIGCVGSTGMSTGPHLHFEVRRSKGGTINPLSLLPRR